MKLREFEWTETCLKADVGDEGNGDGDSKVSNQHQDIIQRDC